MTIDHKNTRRKRWPWYVLGLVGVITFAPVGIAKFMGLVGVYNKWPWDFMIIFWLLFIGLWIADFAVSFRRVRPFAFITGLILVVVNLGGCAAIWGELGGI